MILKKEIKQKLTRALRVLFPSRESKSTKKAISKEEKKGERAKTIENIMHGANRSKIRQQIDPELAETISFTKHKKRLATQRKKHKNKPSSKPIYRKMIRDKKIGHHE